MSITINKDYPCNSANYTKGRSKGIEYIVIHYVGATGSALANVKYYGANTVGASAHFYVGHASENGAVYQSVAPENTAWHCGTTDTYYHDECRNSNSIGIELCCHNDTSDKSAKSQGWYFDDVTVDRAVELTKYLMEQYGINAGHVIRHYDVTHKICPSPFVLDEGKWNDFKERLEEDEMSAIINQIMENTGKTEEEVIEALSVLVKFANTREDDWEKTGVSNLKEIGLINSDHDGREPVSYGAFGLMIDRLKKSLKE